MFTIRPFQATDAEYEALVALGSAVWPDYPSTVEEAKHRDDTRDPQHLFQRMVVTINDEIVASCLYCEPWWALKPGKYHLDINVHPDHRRQGIGTACYDLILAKLAPLKPAVITADTRDDHAEALRFLDKRGFKRVMRSPTSLLDVHDFDPAPFLPVVARVKAIGINILPLSEIKECDPDWQHKYWELDWDLLQDVPSPDPITQLTFENYVTRTFNSPAFNAPSQFIALDGERWVGMSGLWLAPAKPELLFTGLTGVVRSHRRQGIATALKLRGIAYAQDYGASHIETDNEENNPMYQLNLKLGFEPQPAFIEFHKELPAPPETDRA